MELKLRSREEKGLSESHTMNLVAKLGNDSHARALSMFFHYSTSDERGTGTDIIFFFFFFLRKISPELTSAANPPLFAKEDWP